MIKRLLNFFLQFGFINKIVAVCLSKLNPLVLKARENTYINRALIFIKSWATTLLEWVTFIKDDEKELLEREATMKKTKWSVTIVSLVKRFFNLVTIAISKQYKNTQEAVINTTILVGDKYLLFYSRYILNLNDGKKLFFSNIISFYKLIPLHITGFKYF